MTPERRRQLLESSRLGRSVIGAAFGFDETKIHRDHGRFAPTGGGGGGASVAGRVTAAVDKWRAERPDDPTCDSFVRALGAVTAAGFDVPGFDVERNFQEFKQRFGPKWTTVPASVRHEGGQKTLVVNNAYFTINKPAERVAALSAAGHISTNSPDHFFVHELGHILHGRSDATDEDGRPVAWGSPGDTAAAASVSKRAAVNPAEFVAETFAGLVAGKTYPPPVTDLYHRCGGPRPRRPAAFADPAGAKGDLDPAGHWVTVSGNNIHIDSNGEIDAGGPPVLRQILAEKAGLHPKGTAAGGDAGGGDGREARKAALHDRIAESGREVIRSPKVALKNLKPGDHVYSTVDPNRGVYRIEKLTHGGKGVTAVLLENPGSKPVRLASSKDSGPRLEDQPLTGYDGYHLITPELATRVVDLALKVAGTRPMDAPPAAPAEPPTPPPAKPKKVRLEASDKSVQDYSTKAAIKDGRFHVTIKIGRVATVHSFDFPLDEFPAGQYDRTRFLEKFVAGEPGDGVRQRLIDSARRAVDAVAKKAKDAGVTLPDPKVPGGPPPLAKAIDMIGAALDGKKRMSMDDAVKAVPDLHPRGVVAVVNQLYRRGFIQRNPDNTFTPQHTGDTLRGLVRSAFEDLGVREQPVAGVPPAPTPSLLPNLKRPGGGENSHEQMPAPPAPAPQPVGEPRPRFEVTPYVTPRSDEPPKPFTLTPGSGHLVEGRLGSLPVGGTSRGLIEKVSKKTRAALEEAMADPVVADAIRRSRINHVVVDRHAGEGKPKAWTAARTAHDGLMIHSRSAENVEKTTVPERKSGGMKRVLIHEAAHGVWDHAAGGRKADFVAALNRHPEVTAQVAKIVSIVPPAGAWDQDRAARAASEVHSELHAMRQYDPGRYAAMPEEVRKAAEAVWDAATPLPPHLAPRG